MKAGLLQYGVGALWKLTLHMAEAQQLGGWPVSCSIDELVNGA